MKYQVGIGGIVLDTLTGSLAPGSTANFTFTQPYHVTNTNYTICAYTAVVGDIYTQNDNNCKSVTVSPAANDVGKT